MDRKNMRRHILFLLCIVSLLQTSSTDDKAEDEKAEQPCTSINSLDIDDFVDSFIKSVRSVLPDPIDLPDKSEVLYVINFVEGHLHGLSTLYRTGSPVVTCPDSATVYNVPLSMKNMSASYKWTLGNPIKNLGGNIKATVEVFEAAARFKTFRLAETNNVRTQIEKLEITRFKGLEINMTGLGFVTSLISSKLTFVANVIHDAIAECLKGPIKDIINKELKDFDERPIIQ